jgi:hypothetical protein
VTSTAEDAVAALATPRQTNTTARPLTLETIREQV